MKILLSLTALLAANLFPQKPTAHEIRLIGMCHGKLLGAMNEDDFPYGCDWIEAVKYDL